MKLAAVITIGIFATTACVVGDRQSAGSQAASGGDAGIEDTVTDAACRRALCDPLECTEEMHAVTLPDECCPSLCAPNDCSLEVCTKVSCAEGFHPEKPKGACCQTCVRDAASSGTCEQGQEGYFDYRDQLMGGDTATTCTVDSDCRVVIFDNACEHGCGAALRGNVASSVRDALSGYADQHCGKCGEAAPQCPSVRSSAFCTGGYCSLH